MTLREVFDKHGCDKGAHGYAAVYEKLPEPARLLEVGVYKGASLRAWREWWPDTYVDGIDTFERIERREVDVGKNNKTSVLLKADSRTVHLDAYTDERYGLIIDDGSHKPRDQAATLRNLWPLVARDGVYFIEDVFPVDMHTESTMPTWFAKRSFAFNMTAFLELAAAIAATGGKATRHDFRAQSGKPDSVLVEIRKP